MDEELVATEQVTVGEQLRAAREAKGLSLEDVASETRVPFRHLESLEKADWENLPAPTYTIGFAKSYAGAVGLDRSEIGEQLRAEMGGTRPETTVEHFEPVDPARTMPKWVVALAIAGLIAIVLFFTWSRNREHEGDPQIPEETVAEAPAPQGPAPVAPGAQGPVAADAPVVLTATQPAWIQVQDQGRSLFEGILNTGQTYQVPPTATAPILKAGKPEALRITVGNAVAPPVGEAGQVASNVSLRPADLMGTPQAQPGQQPAQQQNSVAQ